VRGEQIGYVGPAPHGQMFRNPFEAHGGFLPNPGRDAHFPGIALGRLAQVRRLPGQPLQFLPQPTQRQAGLHFPPPGAIMGGRHRPRSRQQFLPEFLAAQAPAPLHRSKLTGQIGPPPLFRQPGKFAPSGHAVLWNVLLPQQAIHPQPGRTLPWRPQVVTVAAPRKFFQRLARAGLRWT